MEQSASGRLEGMKLKTFIMLSTNLNFDSTNVKIGKETNMKIHSYKYEYCFNTNPEVSSDQQSRKHVTCLWGLNG